MIPQTTGLKVRGNHCLMLQGFSELQEVGKLVIEYFF